MKLAIPDFSLIVLIGSTGSGKSTFARRFFADTEIITLDDCRVGVSDDQSNPPVSQDAFERVREIAEERLKHRKLTVIDADNVSSADRRMWIKAARRWHALPVAIVLDPGLDVCLERNKERSEREFAPHLTKAMISEIRQGLPRLEKEGFAQVAVLRGVLEIEAADIEREPMASDKRELTGPFDIIGDVHGCADELELLLAKLGYRITWGQAESKGEAERERSVHVTAPPGRTLIFIGDLVDRGPRTPDVLRIAMSMVERGTALVIEGNHENKLSRWMQGRNVKVAHGLQATIDQLEAQSRRFKDKTRDFLKDLSSHYWLDEGRLCVAHAGLKEELIGRDSGAVRSFALYGETSGEADEFGLPVRMNWAADYRGQSAVVYGHVAQAEAVWVNNTICLDTGCCFGGKLTALRWPEKQLLEICAAKEYFAPKRRVFSEPPPAGPPPSKP